MAFGTLTIKLVDSTNVTATLSTTDFPNAALIVQSIAKEGGVWDNNNAWHPVSAIVTVTIS